MRRRTIQMMAAVFLSVTLLGGCGAAPYDLTENEENVIVNYSAHVVAKYNTYQKEGLSYVDLEEESETDEPSEPVSTESDTQDTGAAGAGAPSDGDSGAVLAQTATLNDLFGAEGLKIDYIGARIESSHMESEYFALYPSAGNLYLVLGIDITNEGTEPVTLDYLTMMPGFEVTVNDNVTAKSEITVLSDDLSSFEGTLAAGETRETVLLFQVPETVVSADKVDLVATLNGNNYQIILENE